MKIYWNYNLEGFTETDKLKENDVRVQVPFIGTYEMLDRLIDIEIEREEEYRESEHEEETDCNATFEMAAFLKDYVKNIAYAIGSATLKFREMTSPKYYNFETDKVWASIDKNELWEMYQRVCDTDYYSANVDEVTTYRDGYIPYYRSYEFYFSNVDEMATAPACVLGLILDAMCYEYLQENDVADDNRLNSFELFLNLDSYENLNEYLTYEDLH